MSFYNLLSIQNLVLISIIDNNTTGEEFGIKSDYFEGEHKDIYNIIADAKKSNQHISIGTISSIIESKDKNLQDTFLNIMASTTATTLDHLGGYIQQLKINCNKRKLREHLYSVLHEMEQNFSNQTEEMNLVKHLYSGIDRIYAEAPMDVIAPYDDLKQMVDSYLNGGDPHIPTGFSNIDKKISGFFNGSFIVIGARPSVGKTSLAISLAANMLNIGKKVGFISIEMKKKQIFQRYVAQQLKIALKKLIVPQDNAKIKEQLQAFSSSFSKPFYVDDAPMNLNNMRIKLKKMKKEYDLDIIFIDYLQLISGEEKKRYELVTSVSQELKVIAKELDIPIVALSQLSRGMEQNEDKIPNLSHLKESGSIEQDADMVMLLYKEEKKKQKEEELPLPISTIIVDIAKNRNGETGKTKLGFDKEYSKFVEFSK